MVIFYYCCFGGWWQVNPRLWPWTSPFWFCFVFNFETECCCVAQVGLKLAPLLPQPHRVLRLQVCVSLQWSNFLIWQNEREELGWCWQEELKLFHLRHSWARGVKGPLSPNVKCGDTLTLYANIVYRMAGKRTFCSGIRLLEFHVHCLAFLCFSFLICRMWECRLCHKLELS